MTSNDSTGSDPITLDPVNLAWFAEDYGTTEWCVYFLGMDEITTHDRQYPGNGDDDNPAGNPFTEETIRAYLADFDSRFGPGSPLAVELQSPGYAIALHHGKPAFGSHEHSYAINPPGGSLARPGNCACGHTWAEAEKALDAEMAEIEWSVYVVGPNMNLVAQGQDVLNFVPTGPPHTEATAKEHAAAINEFMARVDAGNPSPFNPVIRAVVLHHGQPVDATAAGR